MRWPRHIQVGTYILVDGYTFKLINLFLGEKKSELTYVKKSLNKGDKDLWNINVVHVSNINLCRII